MIKARDVDTTCGIAQAAAVIGDWWSLLVLREVARGHQRFEELAGELDISRKVLTERLQHLVTHDVLLRQPYQTGPVRYEYQLTPRGQGLLSVLVSMQDWADRWLIGDGALTATEDEAADSRVRALPGTPVPEGLALPGSDGATYPVVADRTGTVLFTYAGTGASLPPDWHKIPGATGCTLENRLFRDAWPAFTAADVAVYGVSTQRPTNRQPSQRPRVCPSRCCPTWTSN